MHFIPEEVNKLERLQEVKVYVQHEQGVRKDVVQETIKGIVHESKRKTGYIIEITTMFNNKQRYVFLNSVLNKYTKLFL